MTLTLQLIIGAAVTLDLFGLGYFAGWADHVRAVEKDDGR